MGACIYCQKEADSKEHPLPRGLGNFSGYTPLTDRLCDGCNRKCGLLDEQLCRSGMEAFFRAYLGISGRKEHEKVNSFYRGSAGGGRLEMLGTNQQTGDNMLLELVGENEVRELRCVQLVADDDTVHVIAIPDGMTPEQFRQRFDALGIKRFKCANAFAGREEIPWVESLIDTVPYEGKTAWSQPTSPAITYGPLTIKFTVTSRYFRCIAKIGFHYFLTKMTQFRGDEKCFADIRHFITNESNVDECRRFVMYTQSHLARRLDAGYRLTNWGHILCAEVDYLNLRAKVQLFVGPEMKSLVHTVQLGHNPSLIVYSEAYGNFFAYHPKEERAEFDGEVSELVGVMRASHQTLR
jgi:hypothetical protein